ncbi:MAG: hypothetical protein LBK56_14560 [Gracilibacteraceae bacterium]|nr:hypothetical protein [Gracilibacteraceae bacterium]
MKVKPTDKLINSYWMCFSKDKIYDVMSIEKPTEKVPGWYRIMTDLDEDYLFPAACFEIVEGPALPELYRGEIFRPDVAAAV